MIDESAVTWINASSINELLSIIAAQLTGGDESSVTLIPGGRSNYEYLQLIASSLGTPEEMIEARSRAELYRLIASELTGGIIPATSLPSRSNNEWLRLIASYYGNGEIVITGSTGTLLSIWAVKSMTPVTPPPGDTTPPALVSAVVDATGLTMVFSEPVTGWDGFQLSVDGDLPAFGEFAGEGTDTLQTIITPPVLRGQGPILSYTQGNPDQVEDLAGNPLESFIDFGVDNNAPSTLLNGLVAYWTLDETSSSNPRYDSHGANNLQDHDVPAIAGQRGLAADFEASTNVHYLSMPNHPNVNFADESFTITGWVNIESKPAFAGIVAKYDDGVDTSEYVLGYSGGADRFRFVVYDGHENQGAINATAFGPATPGEWYFVVAFHDAENDLIGISINGGAPETTAYALGCHNGHNDFEVGRAFGGTPYFFDGAIDELGLWSRRLTSQEITELYSNGGGIGYPFGPNPTGTRIDMLVDFEGMADEEQVTPEILNIGTRGERIGGAWEMLEEPTGPGFVLANAAEVTVGRFALRGIDVSDIEGSKGIKIHNTLTAGRRGARYKFLSSPLSKISDGFAIKIGALLHNGSFNSYDFAAMEGVLGEFFCVNCADGAEGLSLNAHTQAGKSSGTPVNTEQWYWITRQWSVEDFIARLQIYDLETMELVGTEEIALSDQECYSVCLGRYDAIEESIANDWVYYDDLVIDFRGTFPLLPG